MTVKQAIQKLIAYTITQIGYHEGGGNYTKYAESVDLQRWYGWVPQNQPWCDIFVDSMYLAVFGLLNAAKMTYQVIGNGSALCRASAQFYKDHNAWFSSPRAGDQVFFYSGGAINHTGIVEKVTGGIVYTIEGNSSDMVARRSYRLGDPYIAGFGRPDWSVVADGVDDDTVETPAVDDYAYYPMLQVGSVGEYVEKLQTALINAGYDVGPDGADGEYGGNTRAAVIAFQTAKNLEIDGVVGPETWAALMAENGKEKPESRPAEEKQGVDKPVVKIPELGLPVLKTGATGAVVETLQQLLTAKGYTCKVDGEYGAETAAAVRSFQTAENIEADGVVGNTTWVYLLGVMA